MKVKTKKKLKQLFDEAEEQFPDKSTAFLLEIAAQKAHQLGMQHVDSGDIAEALTT